uniref:U60-Liphistoxin-Lth1a_1 n=1 Tax=Liphistius thaleban TaxID=1905330 RepID=A0A4Q8K2Q5_9ARAC
MKIVHLLLIFCCIVTVSVTNIERYYESDGKKIPCWLGVQCDPCDLVEKVGRTNICCKGCQPGRLKLVHENQKTKCWCTEY